MPWAKWYLAGTGVVLVITGIGLIFSAAGWSPNCKPCQVLEHPRRVEWFIYRHHRLFGGAITAGALLLIMLLGIYRTRMVETSLWRSSVGAQLALIAIWVLAAFALIIGAYILIRPSALKGFEAMANRWIEPFPTVVSSVVAWKRKVIPAPLSTPKRTGMLFLLAGIGCLLVVAKMATA